MDYDDFVRVVLTAWADAVIDEDTYTGELIVRTGVIEHNGKIQDLETEKPF